MTGHDVAIVGGGTIGLSIAWRCAQTGRSVAVYDPDPGSGASTVAAGMLAPVAEAEYGEENLLPLNLAAARLWPTFAAELDLGDAYRSQGTLFVAIDDGDAAELERQHHHYRQLGLTTTLLDATGAQQHEPLLSQRVRAGLAAPTDHQVNPRTVHTALQRACTATGVHIIGDTITHTDTIDATTIVIAAGSGSRKLADLPVHPVAGQVLRLNGPDELRHTIRGLIHGNAVYIVPRTTGEVVIGATSHERGHDTTPRAGDTHTLLRTALDIIPELAEYTLSEINVGLRPGTPDNAPLLGPTDNHRIIAATGHFRNGILLAPITADLITTLITTGHTPPELRPFDPRRFQDTT